MITLLPLFVDSSSDSVLSENESAAGSRLEERKSKFVGRAVEARTPIPRVVAEIIQDYLTTTTKKTTTTISTSASSSTTTTHHHHERRREDDKDEKDEKKDEDDMGEEETKDEEEEEKEDEEEEAFVVQSPHTPQGKCTDCCTVV